MALVTISEHIGDHTVLGKICGRNFLKDPGLDKTLMGDGVATAVSAFIGGPANTTSTITQYLYNYGIKSLDFGFGSAGAIVMTILVLLLSSLYIKRAMG